MWIDKEVIPSLIDAVELTVKEEIKAHLCEENQDEDFDPNDIIIFQNFVIPVLEENKEAGFDSEKMLYKGFSFMVSLIPGYLKEHRNKLTPALYGKLAKLYYNHTLNGAISYVNFIDDKYIEENIENINKQIELYKLIIRDA
jgi:hypothetical protein